jgi:hypothetical protein
LGIDGFQKFIACKRTGKRRALLSVRPKAAANKGSKKQRFFHDWVLIGCGAFHKPYAKPILLQTFVICRWFCVGFGCFCLKFTVCFTLSYKQRQ